MDKPFKTIDELICLMNARGISTSINTKGIIEREGYYQIINGYKPLFIDIKATELAGEDRFVSGTTFDQIYSLFEFDRDLRMVLLKYLTVAESLLKSITVYKISERYKDDDEPYLNRDIYCQELKKDRLVCNLIQDFKRKLGRLETDGYQNKGYLKHYLTKHSSVPFWVFVNCLSFGDIFKCYTLQKESMRSNIAKAFSLMFQSNWCVSQRINEKDLRIMYDHLKELRNACAHDERVYFLKVSPAKDISLAHCLKDLTKLLNKEQVGQLKNQISGLLSKVKQDVPIIDYQKLLDAMGIDSFETLFVQQTLR
ncbi:MAG: Abi family protein [Coriobacteriia bacterium]|nr:Abi family protein [Coriobacteriia bacterium]